MVCFIRKRQNETAIIFSEEKMCSADWARASSSCAFANMVDLIKCAIVPILGDLFCCGWHFQSSANFSPHLSCTHTHLFAHHHNAMDVCISIGWKNIGCLTATTNRHISSRTFVLFAWNAWNVWCIVYKRIWSMLYLKPMAVMERIWIYYRHGIYRVVHITCPSMFSVITSVFHKIELIDLGDNGRQNDTKLIPIDTFSVKV